MTATRLTPRQQLLAGAAIGALAFAGSIGARDAGRARCDPASPGTVPPGTPIGVDRSPDPEVEFQLEFEPTGSPPGSPRSPR